MNETIYDIIIVGAGPAGLTAAIYGRRALKNVLVLEANTYGGQIINTLGIDNYPVNPGISGFDFATKLYNQVLDLGATIKFERVVEINDDKIKEVVTTKEKYKAKTVILATGSLNRHLGLADENKLIGKGVSYCATCDGAFYRGKDVAIVGGGNTALEDALYLSDICNKVYLIHRRDLFRGEENTLEKLKKKENVVFILNGNVTKLNHDDALESIEVTDNENNKQIISISGLFIAVGRNPENENFRDLVNLNDSGYKAIISLDTNYFINIQGMMDQSTISTLVEQEGYELSMTLSKQTNIDALYSNFSKKGLPNPTIAYYLNNEIDDNTITKIKSLGINKIILYNGEPTYADDMFYLKAFPSYTDKTKQAFLDAINNSYPFVITIGYTNSDEKYNATNFSNLLSSLKTYSDEFPVKSTDEAKDRYLEYIDKLVTEKDSLLERKVVVEARLEELKLEIAKRSKELDE